MSDVVIGPLVWLDQPLSLRRRSGARVFLPPTAVTDDDERDPVVAVDTGHTFVDRGVEFLLTALLQLAMPPMDAAEWAALYRVPPSPAELAAALAPLRPALDLVHPTHPMLQVRPDQAALDAIAKPAPKRPNSATPTSDDEDEEAGEESIAALLPDRPTSNDVKNNKDVFAKRQTEFTLSAGVVGALLYAHMVLFPLGGGGYLGLPHRSRSVKFALTGKTLWRSLWLNVLGADDARFAGARQIWPAPADRNRRAAVADGRSFAWMRPGLSALPLARGTRLAVHAHEFNIAGIPMQRRYRLTKPQPGLCHLSGAEAMVFAGYARWPGGLDFKGSGWAPLCVAERPTEKDRRRFVQVDARPLRLDDLLEVPIAIGPAPPDGSPRLPALDALAERAAEVGEEPDEISAVTSRLRTSLRATALGGDNVAEFLTERSMPLYRLAEDEGGRMLAGLQESGEALRTATKALIGTAKAVLQPRDRDRKQDRKLAAYLGDTLALQMEDALAHLIAALARTDPPSGHGPAVKRGFVETLKQECVAVFDAAFPLPPGESESAHIAIGRRRLRAALHKSFDRRPGAARGQA